MTDGIDLVFFKLFLLLYADDNVSMSETAEVHCYKKSIVIDGS
mgnify:CR=1 FL=1